MISNEIPFDGILPSSGQTFLLASTLPGINIFDVDGGIPPFHKSSLLLLIVRVQEDKFVGVEEDGILKSVPNFLLKILEIPSYSLDPIVRLLLLIPFKAIFLDMTQPHDYYITYSSQSLAQFFSNSIVNCFIGCVSSVAFSSSLHIFIVLSHYPVIKRIPLRSNVIANMPFYAEMEPGWGWERMSWKL